MSADSPLPPLYARWAAEHLPGPVAPEPRATCATCAMCKGPNGEVPAATYAFDPGVKCCSYCPALPNYLVGRVLADVDPAMARGRASVVDRIRNGVSVSPLGLMRLPTHETLHKASLNADGVSKKLLCPHFVSEDSTCGIWKHRNGVCATWFCKHERGALGRQFWTAVREWFTAIEYALARWCLLELDVEVGRLPAGLVRGGEPPIDVLDAAAMDGRPNEEVQRLLWGSWYGREEAFYIACAERVEALAFADVLRVCGPDVALLSKVVVQAWQRLQVDEVPDRLRLGAMHVLAIGADGAIAVTDSPFDPVGIPALLMSALHYFDGRPTEEALTALAEERGLSLDDRLMRAMLDYRVLVPG